MNLKAQKVQRRGKIQWVVRLGKRFGYKKPKRRFFNSKGKANDFIDEVLNSKKKLGESAAALTFEQRADAAVALSKLATFKISLTDSVEFYIRAHPNGKNSPLFKAFAHEVLKAKELSCGKHTLATYRSDLKHVIPEFGKCLLQEIYQADIEDFALELDLAPRTICNLLDTFTSILNQAVFKGWITRNPAEFVPRPSVVSAPPGILTPIQTARLLVQAHQDRPSMVRPIVVGAFAGLRRAELCRIYEKNLVLEELLIDVPAKAAKTRQRRLVTIQPNLLEWLKATEPTIGPLAGTHNPDVFGEWLRELAVAAGIQNWPHNAIRHSFGSHLIAINKNENTTAAEMGNKPDVVIRSYRAVVRPDVAKIYFDIRPGNVMAIAALILPPKGSI